ncbi:MAG: hypothetical protein K2W92_09875 [Alphaproteobacteria bacterium]|nr:hypothetical protein [Alphaproteobacteria bacterium]
MTFIIMGIFIGTTTNLVHAQNNGLMHIQNHGIKVDHSIQKVSTEFMRKQESCKRSDPRC